MKTLLISLLAILTTTPIATHADILPGQVKAYRCTACHGADGMKSAPTQPAIGGRPTEEIAAILHEYKHLHRFNPAMLPLLLGMSDQDIDDVAEYFALSGGAN